MRAFVTGGAGFIGSTLVDRLLAEGHAVDVVDDLSAGSLTNLAGARRDPDHDFSFQRLDMAAEDLNEVMARRRPDVVYHLAARTGSARSVDDPVADAEVNVVGSLRVLEAARRCGARKVVFATTGTAIYGDGGAGTALKRTGSAKGRRPAEPAAGGPRSPHGVAKASAAAYLAAYRELHDLEYSALALASVYGPRQVADGAHGVVASFVERMASGHGAVIHGDGGQSRDFVYVDDVVDALARAAERGGGLTLNIGTGVETTILELHARVAALMGAEAAPHHGPARPGEVRRSRLDPGRAEIHLGWKPWTTLDAGLAAVVDAQAQRNRSSP